MKKNYKINELLYFISLIAAFTTRYGDYSLGFRVQIIIGIIWIIIFVMQIMINRFCFYRKKEYVFFLKLYIMPHVVVHLYTFFLMLIGKVEWCYLTTNATVYVPTILAILSVYFFREKALKITLVAMIVSWIFSVTVSTMMKGIAIFPHAILEAYTGINYKGFTRNYLELHDLVLAIGYIFVFYIFSTDKFRKKDLNLLFAITLIMILGMKRISILGIIIVLGVNLIIKYFNLNKQIKICNVIGWIGFFLSYLFIYILSLGNIFYDFLNHFGINSRGRIYYFSAIMEYATFSPFFCGIGRNVVTKIFTNELSYMNVGGAHSDIIKMYVEAGFILFGWWVWYYLIHITQKYKDIYGNKAAVLYFGIIVFMFVLFLTDNIEIYFICQMISIILPVTYAMYPRNPEKQYG